MRLFPSAILALLMVPGIAAGAPETPLHAMEADMTPNPFYEEWKTPFGMPPFDSIREEHFLPAILEGIKTQKREVEEIAKNRKAATFPNTIEALDRTGELLQKVRMVFNNLQGAETTEGLQAIARETAPLLAALEDDIYLDKRLYGRVAEVHKKRDRLKLDPIRKRLVEETYKRFVRGGANLSDSDKERLRAVNQELSVLGLRFGDNMLAETNSFRLVVEDPKDLAGLPETFVAAAAEAARKAGIEKGWLFTLHGPSLWPFVQNARNRDLRKRMIDGYAMRGDQGNDQDNREIVSRIAALRIKKSRLLGYGDWASFVLEDRMASSTDRVMDLLDRLWKPAIAVAGQERDALTEAARADGIKDAIGAWDWHYYAEKVRKARYGVDDAELRPYFPLEAALNGVFTLANRLFGITFKEVTGIPLYHPEVRSFEVLDSDGSHLGVFLADYHPRPGKRGGAWCSYYRGFWDLDGKSVRPIVTNVGNFTRPSGDTPALLSLDEVETLFHEMGHALHGLLSRVNYRGLSSVPRDFVELPSQILENWVLEPEVLALYARHYKTGDPIPADLVKRIEDARRFNQGFATTEYLAASYLDMAWHVLKDGKVDDVREFEKAALDRIGLIDEIIPRYRSTYFNHIFGGTGSYSAGYYSYIWSEVLDADAFAAFKEKGLFDQDTARAFRTEILERGGTRDAMEMYKAFRGREPVVEPLLKNRGLTGATR
jgi:peptidyl-dipeptidase Dcp